MIPIKSAPRDGTKFLGRVGEDYIAMYYHPEFDSFISSCQRATLAPGLYFPNGKNYKDHNPTIQNPTSWLPISFTEEMKLKAAYELCKLDHPYITSNTIVDIMSDKTVDATGLTQKGKYLQMVEVVLNTILPTKE